MRDIVAGEAQVASNVFARVLIAVWSGNDQPAPGQCRDAAGAGFRDVDAVGEGTVLCVKTSGGRTAMMKAKEIGRSTVTFDVVVWGP